MTRSALSVIHFCMRERTRPRPSKPRAFQAGWTARPRAAIALTASVSSTGTWAMISPVAGFSTVICDASPLGTVLSTELSIACSVVAMPDLSSAGT